MRRPIDMRGRRAAGGSLLFTPRSFGADLLLWLRDNRGVTLSTVGEWKDQSPSALLFAQATQANRPSASGGAAVFSSPTMQLTSAGNVTTSAGCTVLVRWKLSSTPGAGDYFFSHRFRTDTGNTSFCALFTTGNGAYRSINFTANAQDAVNNYVGAAETQDAAVHTRLFTYNGGTKDAVGSYTYRLDGVAQTVLTSGQSSNGGAATQIGTGATPTDPHGTVYGIVIYSSVLSAANQAAAESLIASSTSTYADFAALGTVVCCLLPGVGQSGDVSAWADQGPAGNNVAQATLAQQPYFDQDDSVGDLKASIVGGDTADFMSRAAVAATNGATAFTVAGWIRQTAQAQAAIARQFRNAGQYQWAVSAGFPGAGNLSLYISSNGTLTAYGAIADVDYTEGAWGHFAFVFDGSGATDADKVKGYLNGVAKTLAFSGTIPTAFPTSTDPIEVLGTNGSYGIAGRLDDIVIIKRALTPAQVARLASYYVRAG